MEVYQPGAIVVCGGADSLSGDRLGCFNLSLQGHAHCMDFLAKFGVPMLVLGGGGYTMRNVARCWCYETGRMLAEELPDECAPHSTPRCRHSCCDWQGPGALTDQAHALKGAHRSSKRPSQHGSKPQQLRGSCLMSCCWQTRCSAYTVSGSPA